MALFGGYKQNPKTAEMFARMSAGERFGQAVGNANQSQIGRDAAAVALHRQQGMDDLNTRYKEAQITNFNRGSNNASTSDIRNDLYRNQLLKKDPTGQLARDFDSRSNPLKYLDLAGQNVRVGAGDITPNLIPGGDLNTNIEAAAREQLAIGKVAADLKLQEDLPTAYSTMMATGSTVSEMIDRVRHVKKLPNLASVTGYEANFPTLLPKSVATEELIDEIQSGAAIEGLIDAKAKGATFGALSDRELTVLGNMISALKLTMDDVTFEAQLDKVVSYMERIDDNIKRAYKAKYGKYAVGEYAIPGGYTEQLTGQDDVQSSAQPTMKFDAQGNLVNG